MKVNDSWIRILLPGILSLLLLYIFVSSGKGVFGVSSIYFLTVLALSETSRLIVYKSRSWFKGWLSGFKRVLFVLLAGILAATLIFIISKALRNYIEFGEFRLDGSYGSDVYVNNTHLTVGIVGSSLFYGIIAFLPLFLLYEIVYHFARLRFIEKQRDRFEKEKLQAELQQLKGIVNPHFLFNNLNSLSSLISENPAQAEDFLNELTKVFRYLLRNNNAELTTAEEELQFINSYYHLLQTRYGKSISMTVNVHQNVRHHLLPPLTLQLLVENAVKHNRLQKDLPLQVEIYSEPNCLVVRNTIYKREKPAESTGIGLHSINTRYKLLQHPGLTIRQDDSFFCVQIPLIESGNTIPVFSEKINGVYQNN